MPKRILGTINDSREDHGNATTRLNMQDSERSLDRLHSKTGGEPQPTTADDRGNEKNSTINPVTQCEDENPQQSRSNTHSRPQHTTGDVSRILISSSSSKQDPKISYVGNRNTSSVSIDHHNLDKHDFYDTPLSTQEHGETSQQLPQNLASCNKNAHLEDNLKTSQPTTQQQKSPKPNFSVGDVFTLTLRPIKREHDDSHDGHQSSEADFKTLKVQIVEEKSDDEDDSQQGWISVDSEDSFQDGVRNRAITKKEKHRYAAARYRQKEMVIREQLKKDEKKLSSKNLQLQQRIQTLSSVKAACIAQLKSISTQKLCEGVSTLATLIPPGHEEALVSVKAVLYQAIANQIKELAHIYKTPATDQVVPEQNTKTGQREEMSESGSSSIFTLSRVTSSLFALKEVNASEETEFAQDSPVKVQVKITEISDASSDDDSTPDTTLRPDFMVETLPDESIADQQHSGEASVVVTSANDISRTNQQELPAQTFLLSPVQDQASDAKPGHVRYLHGRELSCTESETDRSMACRELIYTESGSVGDMNPGSTEPVCIPAQILLPMPILEQAAPIDLSKKKQTHRSDGETGSVEKTPSSALMPVMCTNGNELESQCDQLDLLATTALAMDLTKRDTSQSSYQAAVDDTRQRLQYEVPSVIGTQNDSNRMEISRRRQPDIEMVHFRDADDESSREAPFSPPSGPIDLSSTFPATKKNLPDQTTPAWKNLSTTGPVVVWVQSMSTGIGELPSHTDAHQISTDAAGVTYGSTVQSSGQSSSQSSTQSTFQPGIPFNNTNPQVQSNEESIKHFVQHPPTSLPGDSRQHFPRSTGDNVQVVQSSPDKYYLCNSRHCDTTSLSSSEDGEPCTSGQDASHQMKLLHRHFTSPQKGTPLIGDTRRERQRHASKKNRVKNQMMKRALLQDEKHLTSTNSKLRGTVQQLEAIKCACLGMLATSNQHLTTQLSTLTTQNLALKPYWDSLGIAIALKVPDPYTMEPGMEIEGALPFKELRLDAKTWPEPMNPQFLSQVLMNVKVNGLEWNGSLLSKGDVCMVTEKGEVTVSSESGEVTVATEKGELTMGSERGEITMAPVKYNEPAEPTETVGDGGRVVCIKEEVDMDTD